VLSDQYEDVDRGLAAGELRWTRDLAINYAEGVQFHPVAQKMAEVKAISMLGLETLMMCRGFALSSQRRILEIGPYIGGSTIAMAMGIAETRRSHIISIDHGGSYPDKTLPTDDVHTEWRRNLAARQLADFATLVPGFSNDEAVIAEVGSLVGDRKIDVLLLDADGDVDGPLKTYAHLLADDCLLIVDDYFNVRMEAENKMARCTAQLHDLMRAGAVREYVLVPWGTWFGRLNREQPAA